MHSFPVSSEAFHRSSPGRRSIHIHRPGLGRTLWLEIPDVVSDWLMEANWWSGRQNIQLQKWAEKWDGFEIEGASNVEIFCTAVASMLPMSSTSICHVGQHMAAKSIASNMERHRVLALQFGVLSVRHGCSRFYFPSIVYLILSTPCWLNIKKYTSHISLRSRILLTCRSESLPPYVEEFPYCRISQGKSATGPDREFAWQALWKDATVPP